ncbi:MAG TPA: hypothetical protein VJG83_04275 [archaeon]|nr:hypothetical protein [archaeon]
MQTKVNVKNTFLARQGLHDKIKLGVIAGKSQAQLAKELEHFGASEYYSGVGRDWIRRVARKFMRLHGKTTGKRGGPNNLGKFRKKN